MTPQTSQTLLRFNGDWSSTTVFLIGIFLAVLMFFYYRRELRFHTTTPRWVLPTLRSLAVLMLFISLAGPVLRHEEVFRKLGRVLILTDASASMAFGDDTNVATASTNPSRFERAQQSLLRPPTTLIQTLAKEHNVELFRLSGNRGERIWWHRDQGKDVSGELPSQIGKPEASQTNLDAPVRAALGASMADAAVILLTDGQHNMPGSPEMLAEQMGNSSAPIFTIGYGQEMPPPDLALSRIVAPEAVFPDGRAEGVLHLNDHLPEGLPATVTITSQNKQLWQQSFTTKGNGPRQIPFSFAVAELNQADGSKNNNTLRLLDVRVELAGENAAQDRITQNNESTLAFHVLSQKRKLLILDGRPRWETRYVHTHFDRDERWQVTTAFDDYKDGASNAIQRAFPKDEREMLTYDLIILGDLRPDALQPAQHEMIRNFVEKRGGGLILLDGERGHLQAWRDTASSTLIPVSWGGNKDMAAPYTHDLTSQGLTMAALSLSDSPSTNQMLWEQLPKANWAAKAEPLPDAAVLGELHTSSNATTPGMVWRRFGAGSVLWLGTDEFWRWRYEVADLHHQRFWMQLAAWIAAPPFIMEDDKLSLGMGQLRYREGDKAELRVRLRDGDGKMIDQANLRAHVMRNGKQVATLQLDADPSHGGVFRGLTSNLAGGDYSVSISRDNKAVSDLNLQFRVEDTANQEWSNLTLNRPLLETMARNSGGRFLREGDINQLPDLLRQIDRKETRIHETLLWSSWWWFGIIIALLTLEWLLRKHWRLV